VKPSVGFRVDMPSHSDSTRHGGRTEKRRVETVLESTVESADVAESLVSELSDSSYDERERHQISLAVREAVANAVLHGNQFASHKKVFFTAELHSLGLVISITDEGKGCEPELVPDPLESANLLRESGRGMLLVRECMDEVTWRRAPSGGMELIMTKHFSKSKENHR
jgi:serine/threonine-protein kinase RsbW